MNSLMKWIGGSTIVALVLIGTMAFGGNALVAQSPNAETAAATEMASWLEAEDILRDDTSVNLSDNAPLTPAPAMIDLSVDQAIEVLPEYVNDPVIQDVPAYDEDNPFVIKRILPIDGPIRYGEWHWDDEGIPDGPLVITVDLDARVISVFRDGYEIGAAAALLGTPEHPTPLGVFPILTKERHNVSEKYNNAPMPWTLRMTWDGVAIHGGSQIELGYASHGCVGVPDGFAARLYEIASVGDVVIVTRGQNAGIGSSLAS